MTVHKFGLLASFLLMGTALGFGGGGGGGSPTPPPSSPPPSYGCTLEISSADQVVYPGLAELRFTAHVGGGCSANAVQWTARYVDPYGTVSYGSNPYSTYDSNIPYDYSSAIMPATSLDFRMPKYQDLNAGYTEIVASLNGITRTVRVIGDDEAPGKTTYRALTQVFNTTTLQTDKLPFWYFVNLVQKSPQSYSPAFTRFQSVNLYVQPSEYDWYASGFGEIGDQFHFDPYYATNTSSGYVAARPPGDSALGYASLDKPPVKTQGQISAQVLNSCPSGSCVGIGGIFLGRSDKPFLSQPWSYWTSGLSSMPEGWTHAAIKTGSGFIESPGLGFSVTAASVENLTNRYNKYRGFFSVPGGDAYGAAQFAQNQHGKPYSVFEYPKWTRKGDSNASYKSWYCSLLVWAAWYHGGNYSIVNALDAEFASVILPNHIYMASRTGKINHVAQVIGRNQ